MTDVALGGRTGSPAPVGSVPLFRRGSWYRSRDAVRVSGRPGSASVGLAPNVMLIDDARRLQQSQATTVSPAERFAILERAVERFRAGDVRIDGRRQGVDDFTALLDLELGIPPALSHRWADVLAERLRSARSEIDAARREAAAGLGLVSLPANTFLCLEAALRLALECETVWLRPSRREPFSSARLVAAMLEEGWPPERIGHYPTRPQDLHGALDLVDRAIVYGGCELERSVARRPMVAVEGPGAARAVVGDDVDPVAAAAWLVPLVVGDGGRLCTNVGTILTFGAADDLGTKLAEQLDRLPAAATGRWPLASSVEPTSAAATADWVDDRLAPGDRVLTRRALVQEINGRTMLVPMLVQLAEPEGHPLLGVELMFPFAVLARTSATSCHAHVGDARFVSTFGDVPVASRP